MLTVAVPYENPNDDTDDSYSEIYTITQLDDSTMILTEYYPEGEDYFTDTHV